MRDPRLILSFWHLTNFRRAEFDAFKRETAAELADLKADIVEVNATVQQLV